MRITGYRTLTTVHDWGRPVGDANGVFPDGVVTVYRWSWSTPTRASPVSASGRTRS